jgi:CBS domain-containing protein
MTDHSPTAGFARRLAHVRALLGEDSAAAGDQGLKLLEEYLEHLALTVGYHQATGSIGRYVSWLRKRGPLSRELLDRCETYAQVRNCLAHSYGLQTSPALAVEVVEFLGAIIRHEGATAAQMMSPNIRSVAEDAPLREARDTMLRERYGRLPVLRGKVVTALLTERDLVAAEADADANGATIDALRVRDILPAGARRRFQVVEAAANHEAILAALRRSGIEALIVTRDGRANQPPLGIITHADVLFRS